MRSSRKVYNDGALEAWLEKLDRDWERHFSEEELKGGRKLYCQGAVLEVELNDRDAVIHTKSEDLPVYAVVDWENFKPAVRFSLEDELLGRTIAVAGLYEVEELVAEEVSPLPPDFNGISESAEEDGDDSDTEDEAVEESVSEYGFILSFYLHRGTLAFRPFWLLSDSSRIPAIGPNALDGEEVSSSDREQLIRLMSLAKRADFKFSTADDCYILDEVSSIPLFLSKDWRTWKNLFNLEYDSEVKLMFKGNQILETSAEVKRTSSGITIEWDIFQNGSKLNSQETKLVLKTGGGMKFLSGRGLVTLENKDAENIKAWQERLDHEFSSSVPPYMLFSSFQKDFNRVEVSAELEKWKKAYFRTPGKLDDEPEILRDYQRSGVRWLAHLFDRGVHAMLADEMGLGKTLQILSLLHVRPIADKPHLIICPASVIPVWQHEAARFFPYMKLRVLGKSDNFSMSPGPHIWLSSYTQIRRHKHLLAGTDFGYCILDEAQFIKNPAAKVTQACMLIKAAHRVVLTGTPIENNYRDLWTLFRFLLPGLLGNRSRFESRLHDEGDAFTANLRKQIAPFFLRRLKTDVAEDLPEKVEIELMCPMSELQRQQYDKLVEEGVTRFSDAWEDGRQNENLNILTLFTRLRQVSCDPGLIPGSEAGVEQSGKLSVLNDRLCELLQSGHKVVVFSQFVKLINRVKKLIKGSSPNTALYELTGKTRDRQKPVEQFQSSDGGALMLVSLKAGGTGITLHAADYVFLLDPWWNPAVEAQAIDRVHRIGQTKKVFVYRMVTQGSIEEKIQQLKSHKMDIFNQVLEDMPKLLELREAFGSIDKLLSIDN